MVQLMPVRGRLSCSTNASTNGVALVELLVVVVILGVVSAISLPGLNFVLRRERVNAVALSLAGWLEEVRNLAARRVDDSAAEGGCAIQLSPAASMASGAVLATVEAACGARDNSFVLPQNLSGTLSASSTNGNSIIFTPRGLWISSPSVSGELQIKLLLDGGGPLRCVRISETLGSIDIGRANSSSINSECTDYTAL
jgi:prepilin-type N-terminal cleavage/methylation domain-containing protein